MKILSLISHPHVVPNLYEFCLLLSTKEDILKMLLTKQLPVAINFHSMAKYHGSKWLPATVWLPTFFKISLFCVHQKKDERFGITWGWVNDDKLFILSWTFLLTAWIHMVMVMCSTRKTEWRILSWEALRGHVLMHVAPKLYFPSGLGASWWVLGS